MTRKIAIARSPPTRATIGRFPHGARNRWRLSRKKKIEIGVVKPFAIDSIAAESNRYAGRRIIIHFSKQLAEDVTSETISRWISVTPVPEKLTAEVAGETVTLKGNFALGPKYRVATKAGIPAKEPFN